MMNNICNLLAKVQSLFVGALTSFSQLSDVNSIIVPTLLIL